MDKIETAVKCLNALGSAYRGDWSGIDGRAIRSELEDITEILTGSEMSYEVFCENNEIDKDKKCWSHNI